MTERLFDSVTHAVGYEAFGHEIRLSECDWIPERLREGMSIVPKTPPEPLALAAELSSRLGADGVCVFVPGTRFDASGTRIGRGGGWYDRFLASVPKNWLRVGVADAAYFSETPLPRAPHDEPVDFMFIRTDENWKTIETRARTAAPS